MRLHNPNTPITHEKPHFNAKRKISASLLAASLLLPSACGTNNRDTEAKRATKVEAQVVHNIFAKKPVEILPGAISTDGQVTVRSTPAIIDTENKVSEYIPVSFLRPLITENDGSKWLGGVTTTGELDWVALNEQTMPHLKYYSAKNQPAASFCNDQLLGAFKGVVSADSDGLFINPDGFRKDVSELDFLTGPTGEKHFVESMKSAGYTPTKLCP